MIWTKEENELRQFDNMINCTGKSCKNCNWSNYEKGDTFITCGHHHQNFSIKSLCAYWTNPNDPKLLAYNQREKERIMKKLKAKI